MDFSRYAIFYTAPDPWATFGARWLGWDNRTAEIPAPWDIPGLDRDAITTRPRRYGFHATLKPPLRLAPGKTPEGLQSALGAIAARTPAFTLPPFTLSRIGSFLALTLSAPCPPLTSLAAELVRDLDPFRAPLTEAEIARRNPHRLTPAQRGYLDRYGYPYVLDSFQFHMTLTGPLPKDQIETTQAQISTLMPAPSPMRFDCITLLGERPDGFHTLSSARLAI